MSDATYRGTITRITPQGIFVIVPKLGSGVEYGPCPRVYAHSHDTVGLYRPGVPVLVSTINGIPDDLVVIGVLG